MPFPLIKLFYLGIKQVSKPMSTSFTRWMKSSPNFRNRVMIPMAQVYHRVQVNLRMKLLGQGKAEYIAPLQEEAAVALATDMTNDFLLFVIAAGVLYLEYLRSSQSSALEKMQRENEILSLENKINDLFFLSEKQEAQIRELSRDIGALHSQNESLTTSFKRAIGKRSVTSNKDQEQRQIQIVVRSEEQNK